MSDQYPTLARPANPATDYADAVARIQALQAKDGPEVRPDSRTKFWAQGQQAERALVYYHGYTNAPPQFDQLGEQLFQQGYNVLVPRLPHHGLQDPLTKDQALLTAEELAQMVQDTVDMARGLGKQVTIAGLSAGGVMAAWAAQFRADVDLAVVISPAFGLPFAPAWVSGMFRGTMPHLPNLFIWWDPRVKEKIVGPPHAYPRFSTKGLAETFRLGKVVRDAAAITKPLAKHIQVVTSAFDAAIHLPTVYKVTEEWKAHGGNVTTYEFPKDEKIWHDMVDPQQSTQRIDVVYPVLLPLLTQAV